MPAQVLTLFQLGWRPGYSQQLTLEDFEAGYPARVVGVHRSGLSVLSSRGAATLPRAAVAVEPAIAVGDWLLIDMDAPRVMRVIERQSLIARAAAGPGHRQQAMAANLDTLFVVTSCNEDFNPSRLERYLALAFEAGVEPVIVLTKADLCDDIGAYRHAVRAIAPGVASVAVDATPGTTESLLAWLGGGQTVAFVGSPGVGKSSLINALMDDVVQSTGDVRVARVRHTATVDGMFLLPGGAWVIDTPDLRGLQVDAMEEGVLALAGDD